MLSFYFRSSAQEQIDAFGRLQLQSVIELCRRSRSIVDVGRALFGASCAKRSAINDSDRLRKILQQLDSIGKALRNLRAFSVPLTELRVRIGHDEG
jgi:sigma54-dependent transcription regulator